jgi:hypothetical protein
MTTQTIAVTGTALKCYAFKFRSGWLGGRGIVFAVDADQAAIHAEAESEKARIYTKHSNTDNAQLTAADMIEIEVSANLVYILDNGDY